MVGCCTAAMVSRTLLHAPICGRVERDRASIPLSSPPLRLPLPPSLGSPPSLNLQQAIYSGKGIRPKSGQPLVRPEWLNAPAEERTPPGIHPRAALSCALRHSRIPRAPCLLLEEIQPPLRCCCLLFFFFFAPAATATEARADICDQVHTMRVRLHQNSPRYPRRDQSRHRSTMRQKCARDPRLPPPPFFHPRLHSRLSPSALLRPCWPLPPRPSSPSVSPSSPPPNVHLQCVIPLPFCPPPPPPLTEEPPPPPCHHRTFATGTL